MTVYYKTREKCRHRFWDREDFRCGLSNELCDGYNKKCEAYKTDTEKILCSKDEAEYMTDETGVVLPIKTE